MEKMGIPPSHLMPTKNGFHGIVPGREANAIGQITIDVVFCTLENYRLERLLFDVVPFKSGYHVLLGRHAFVKFMVVPNYAYLKLKMSG